MHYREQQLLQDRKPLRHTCVVEIPWLVKDFVYLIMWMWDLSLHTNVCNVCLVFEKASLHGIFTEAKFGGWGFWRNIYDPFCGPRNDDVYIIWWRYSIVKTRVSLQCYFILYFCFVYVEIFLQTLFCTKIECWHKWYLCDVLEAVAFFGDGAKTPDGGLTLWWWTHWESKNEA